MLIIILSSKPAYPTYVVFYLHRPYNSLSPVLPPDLFAALTPPTISTNTSGSGLKDIKMKPITKWDNKAKSLKAFFINCFTHFEF